VHDGIAFEKRGIPAAVICTDQFAPTANAIAEVQGLPGYRYAVVRHPTGRIPEAELLERVREALPQLLTILGIEE
jgi:hypothetical protein